MKIQFSYRTAYPKSQQHFFLLLTVRQLEKRKEVSELLDISMDTLRNWEMNGLLTVRRKDNGYRIYTDKDIQRLKIIRTLRCANYCPKQFFVSVIAVSKYVFIGGILISQETKGGLIMQTVINVERLSKSYAAIPNCSQSFFQSAGAS